MWYPVGTRVMWCKDNFFYSFDSNLDYW